MNHNLPLETERQFAATLATVRELSERWHHRPAPNRLRCIPVQTLVIKPMDAFKRRIDERLEVALLLAQMSREYATLR